uniref:Uncharacterized protein n=1 Tax=Pantoea phage Survivor TaxID=3232176 RepID=A0AAU8KXF5_9CAUD
MSKKTMMIELLCTSGLSMYAREHGGALTDGTSIETIIDNVDVIETGYTQGLAENEIKDLIRSAIIDRDLSKAIDIWKEVCATAPHLQGTYELSFKAELIAGNFTVDPLYLARFGTRILEGHMGLIESRAELRTRASRIFHALVDADRSPEERSERIKEFMSIMMVAPHIQRDMMKSCLHEDIVTRHFDPLSSGERVYALEQYLQKLIDDDAPETDVLETPVVPKLEVVEDKPEEAVTGYLHFAGTAHLLGGVHKHGHLGEEVTYFHELLQPKAGSKLDQAREAISYIHRSEHQRALCAVIFRNEEMAQLDALDDPRKRAYSVEDQIVSIITTGTTGTSIYGHQTRSQRAQVERTKAKLEQPQRNPHVMNQHIDWSAHLTKILTELSSITGESQQELLKRMGEFKNGQLCVSGTRANQFLTQILNNLNPGTVSDIASPGGQLNYLLGAFSEPRRRVQAAAVPVKGLTKPHAVQPMQISGGSVELRQEMASMFDQMGVDYIFTDVVEPPKFEETARQYLGHFQGVTWQMTYQSDTQIASIIPVLSGKPAGAIGFDIAAQNLDALWELVKVAVTTQSPRKYLIAHSDSVGAHLSREVAVTLA